MIHKPVLLKETIDALDIKEGETILDGTLGAAGHTTEIVRRFGNTVRVIGLDRDTLAIEHGEHTLRNLGADYVLVKESFRNLDKVLTDLGIESVDAVLLDLGISSDQLDDSARGFSFKSDAPLDMRMSGEGPTAADIVASFTEEALELILRGFGEEKYSRAIANAITRAREVKPIETTGELVKVIESVKPRKWWDKIHPATQTFQALRIAVNDELTALEEGLERGFKALSPGGRLAIISFHSLEDRIVKNFFRDRAGDGQAVLITKKPVTAVDPELSENPRSRSAKLRAIEKI